jgi:hypothetical protein
MTSFAGVFRVRAEKLPFRRLNPSVQEFQNTNIKLPALYANHNSQETAAVFFSVPYVSKFTQELTQKA